MMTQNSFTTPEGFNLPQPLLMPQATQMEQVITYIREWDYSTMNGNAGAAPKRQDLIPVTRNLATGSEVGPFCSVDLAQVGGPRSRPMAVIATDETIAAMERFGTDDINASFSFKMIAHKATGRVLIIAQRSDISSSLWLAYVRPESIPAPM